MCKPLFSGYILQRNFYSHTDFERDLILFNTETSIAEILGELEHRVHLSNSLNITGRPDAL